MGAEGSKMSEADMKFLVANTDLSQQEIELEFLKYKGQFPDGKVSESALKKFFEKVYPDTNPDAFASLMFKSFDTDRNGKINFREFLLAINVLKNKDKPLKLLGWAFDICDISHGGLINKKELETVMKASYNLLGKTPEQMADKVFNRMDKNHDGQLTREEFNAGCAADPFLLQLLTGGVADVLAAYKERTAVVA
ncbi:hypothetical protein BaRGS_00025288 [Batillaria attramentaria]|uniref:EF-hand domain-containing protein n=1 Tax=Batillaria attramentaria TaxID=370345 RepID=A0ABD0K8P7_9CAEN